MGADTAKHPPPAAEQSAQQSLMTNQIVGQSVARVYIDAIGPNRRQVFRFSHKEPLFKHARQYRHAAIPQDSHFSALTYHPP